jgi:2-dehydro-3-deoxyphosphooctonate aldolase (KDO 8-P synthase)|tara:strand:- start:4006 stop:4815 length:810 start_codon:yes stop_codon:yes gene_type:complete
MLKFKFQNSGPLKVIAGPCQIESRDHAMLMAEKIADICHEEAIRWVYKSSFDKANRSSMHGKRGVGIDEGLKILQEVKDEFECGILTDIHLPDQADPVSKVADILQIPAFLSRQTDLIEAASDTGKIVNVKKGQFMSYTDVGNIVEKVFSTGNTNCMITERGTSFGYNNLVVDMRGLAHMKRWSMPLIFDGTHSVQQPGALGSSSGGDRTMIEPLCLSAVAQGIAGVFLEVHDNPKKAPSDGPNMLEPEDFQKLIRKLKILDATVKMKL